MFRIPKAVSVLCILIICFRFVVMNESEESSYLSSNINFSGRNVVKTKSETLDKVPNDYSHEHIAVQKWRKNDALSRKMCVNLYNKILPFIANGTKDTDLSSGCSKALMKTLIGIKQYKAWAFKMIDSSGKLPTGILHQDVKTLGNYDECLGLKVPGSFQGQYCNVEVKFPLPERQRFVNPYTRLPEFEDFYQSVSEDSVTAEMIRDLRFAYIGGIETAVCVPSTCSEEEIQQITNKVVKASELTADIIISNCEILPEKTEFGWREIIIMSVFGIFVFIGITSTFVDIYLKLTTENEDYQDNISLRTKYLLCFSFYTNTRRLLSPDISDDSIKVFHGMKVISILWVILIHTYAYQVTRVFYGGKTLISYNSDYSFQVFLQAAVQVDAFFFMSSVVHSYAIMKFKYVKINYGLHIFRRILRLSIPAFFVMACAFLVPYLGSGPVWKKTTEDLIHGCRYNWWTNLLFINNFIKKDDMCLGWFWYIAADTQLFLLSLFVIIPMRRNPRLAFGINLGIFIGGIFLSEVFRYYYGLIRIPSHAYIHYDDNWFLINKEHHPTYEHTAPSCVGLVVGYFLAKKCLKMKIPLKLNIVLWLSVFVITLSVIYGPYEWNQGNIPNLMLCILYKATRRILWSLAIGWVTIACMTGNGGIIYDILAFPGFTVFARLTYMAFLLHPIIHIIHIGSTRTLIEMTHRSLVYIYIGNVVLSFICAYVFSLLIESPFTALQNLMLSSYMPENLKKSKISNGLTTKASKIRLSDSVSTEEDNAPSTEKIASGYSSREYQKLLH